VPFVLDASVVICWVMHDKADPRADAALLRVASDRAMTPGNWWFEVRNILIQNERRSRITARESERRLDRLQTLTLESTIPPDGRETMRLARKHNLTVYDAAYLALAKAERIPLATLDRGLEKAAKSEGITLLR
jgi:predicted nucleic acid-binding protein